MSVLSFIRGAVAGLAFVFGSGALDATGTPLPRTFGFQASRALSAQRTRPGVRHIARMLTAHGRSRFAASCGSGTSGTHAFDSSTSAFGSSNLATGDDSGVLEGDGNTICDKNSAIGAGTSNSIDSGTGNTPDGAQESFVGAGRSNTVSSNDSFLGAGYGNTVSEDDSSLSAGIYNTVFSSDSSLGAGSYNTISSYASFLGAGLANSVTGPSSFIGAGGSEYAAINNYNEDANNIVAGTDAFIGAGDLNAISSSGNGSFIGGGGYTYASNLSKAPAPSSNQISGVDSFIGAGDQNVIAAAEAVIGGGSANAIKSGATGAFIGSGLVNSIAASGVYGSILGGYRNTMSGQYASIIGGYGNTASGSYAIVAGGNSDTAAGILSFAAGYHAKAIHNGTFVWSDYVSGSATIADTAANQFVARASGGVYLYSNEGATSGVKLSPGSGTWASLSDRNAKTDVVLLDDASVLAKVAALPVSTWRYKTESGVRHVGPMAQDFYAAFGVGEDNRHITSIDEDGVALAAIKALHEENLQKDAEIALLRENVVALGEKLRAKDAALENRLRKLELQREP